jgi:hypothetical protein
VPSIPLKGLGVFGKEALLAFDHFAVQAIATKLYDKLRKPEGPPIHPVGLLDPSVRWAVSEKAGRPVGRRVKPSFSQPGSRYPAVEWRWLRVSQT